jgi:hypothetical protein
MGAYDIYAPDAGKLIHPDYIPHFSDISEQYPENLSALLDQNSVQLKNLTEDQRHWRDRGYIIKRNFIPHSLIDEYLELRRRLDLGDSLFPDCHPHLYSSAIRDMCCSRELHYLLVDLIGEEMGLHFSLNGFKSSERGWHQDDYLNPGDSMARYLAIWMAMGDIHPDSGPFEFIPGSHKWPCLTRKKVWSLVVPELRSEERFDWCYAAEYPVNRSVENYMTEQGVPPLRFDAKKGDILIWHSKLMHRGSIPKNPFLSRPSLISHYSPIRTRRDIGGEITRHGNGGYFWEFSATGEALSEDKVPRSDPVEQGRSSYGEAPSTTDLLAMLQEMKEENQRLGSNCLALKTEFAEFREALENALAVGWNEIHALKPKRGSSSFLAELAHRATAAVRGSPYKAKSAAK